MKHAFYILSHPFDGFWVLKSEKKGTVKSALILLALFIATTAIRVYSTGYLISGISLDTFSIFMLIGGIVLAFLLYSVSNWAFTTLMSGKGKFSEVFIALCYASLPVILFNIPLTVISNFITLEEAAFFNFFNIISILWMLFLVLAGNLSTHDYTMFKSIATFIVTVVVMLLIVILVILFGNLLQQVYVFIESIVKEIAFRL